MIIGAPWLHLAHAVEVHDRRPVDAREVPRVERVGERPEAFPPGVCGAARVQAHVVALGLDPVDAAHLHHDQPPFPLDRESAGDALRRHRVARAHWRGHVEAND